MREYRFRGKHVVTGKWFYGYLLAPDLIGVVDTSGVSPEIATYCRVDPQTVGQYTGLKDKNGVEIYEGDIVTTVWCDCPEDTPHEVDMEDACYYAGKHELSEYEFEIIGNIHDTPNPLEATSNE